MPRSVALLLFIVIFAIIVRAFLTGSAVAGADGNEKIDNPLFFWAVICAYIIIDGALLCVAAGWIVMF
jgi:hypothetical protein